MAYLQLTRCMECRLYLKQALFWAKVPRCLLRDVKSMLPRDLFKRRNEHELPDHPHLLAEICSQRAGQFNHPQGVCKPIAVTNTQHMPLQWHLRRLETCCTTLKTMSLEATTNQAVHMFGLWLTWNALHSIGTTTEVHHSVEMTTDSGQAWINAAGRLC